MESTTYLNAGALVNGFPPKTKKALGVAIRDNPESVDLVQTSDNKDHPAQFRAVDLPGDGHVIASVVGPDPFNKRTWYADVKRDKDGKLVVT